MKTTTGAGASVPAQGETAGVLYAALAYILWGILPVYWRILDAVPAFTLSVHRIFWCAVFVGGLTWWRGRLKDVRDVLRQRKLLLALCCSSLLIAANWTIYIFAIAEHKVVEASLGYFLNPLLSILLGVFLLGEKISFWRIVAVLIASVGLVAKTVTIGHVPLIAVSLALTFGFYGYVRKQVPVDPLDGLFIESGLLMPFTLVFLLVTGFTNPVAFPRAPIGIDALLVLAGPITAVPLALFAAGARRIRLSTLGFVQYFSPAITLVVAVWLFHEPFGGLDLISFGCIWAALVLVIAEKQLQRLIPATSGV